MATIVSLPDAVLQQIFDWLCAPEQLKLLTVCRRFYQVMPCTVVTLGRSAVLDMPTGSGGTDGLEPVKRPKLSLEAAGDVEAPTWRRLFPRCRSLTYDEQGGAPSELGLVQWKMLVQVFPNVVRLIMPVTQIGPHAIESFPRLKQLSVAGFGVDVRSGEESFGKKAIALLGRLDWLEIGTLRSEHAVVICGAESDPIPGLRKLRLEIARHQEPEVDFDALVKCLINLESVEISDAAWDSSFKIPLHTLARLTSLHAINVELAGVSFVKMDRPGCFPAKLQSLRLVEYGSRLSQFGHLAFLPDCLTRLCLREDDYFSLDDLELLPPHLSLTYLDVGATPCVCNQLFTFLIQRAYPLKTLELASRGYEITSGGVARYLRWTTCLERLSLWGHSGVTDTIFRANYPALHRLRELRIFRTAIRNTAAIGKSWGTKRATMTSKGKEVAPLLISGGFKGKRLSRRLPGNIEVMSPQQSVGKACKDRCCVSWW